MALPRPSAALDPVVPSLARVALVAAALWRRPPLRGARAGAGACDHDPARPVEAAAGPARLRSTGQPTLLTGGRRRGVIALPRAVLCSGWEGGGVRRGLVPPSAVWLAWRTPSRVSRVPGPHWRRGDALRVRPD